jgi:hypothetical protein
VRPLPPLLALLVVALLAVGCGNSKEKSSGPVISGPGIAATDPPWKPSYTQLAERMKQFKIPPPGSEKFHHHAQLHVYNDGLLVEVPTHIGIGGGTVAGLHTHAPGGVIHIESTKPFKPTLGGFFAIWGVPFGPQQVGNLKNDGKMTVHVLVNGKPVADPINYVMHDGDNIVVGYGEEGSFPKTPDVKLLREEQAGVSGGCGEQKKGQPKQKSCTAK